MQENNKMTKLAVVLVNYNVRYYLEQTIESVYRASKGLTVQVWVVDNASTDGSEAYIRGRFPDVHYLYNRENQGFSRANNQAIRMSDSEYVLLLNPDTIVGEDTLVQCVAFLDTHLEAGAVGVAMLKDDGGFAWESRRGVPTPFTAFCKMSGLGALFPESRVLGRYYMRYLDRRKPNEIDIISGAYIMMRRQVLDKVGLLDETFFMYGEDIDLSYRIQKGGYKNYYLPVTILHYKGESTQKSSFRYVHSFYNAMLIFYNKHFRRKYLLLTSLIHAAVVVRGAVDYLKHKFEQRVDLLWNQNLERKKLLCVGGRKALEGMRRIVDFHHLEADYVATDEHDGYMEKLTRESGYEAYDCVIYDVDSFSYQTILHLLEQGRICMDRKKLKKEVILGTYSIRWNHIITHKKVWEGKDENG